MATVQCFENKVSVQANVSVANVKPRSGGRSPKPGCLDNCRQKALGLMLADPLRIRRPLMEVDGQRRVGFDPEAVGRWIGLAAGSGGTDLETCPRQHAPACEPPPA